ncbi:MAG: sigma-70 family RNA polymerase sigma factor [Planctomycetes bacterium]|nr:sigma-70 family RNA polymerase sigma factor [Planctomycetota bacterium]
MHDTPHSLLEQLQQRPDKEAWAQFAQLYYPVLVFLTRRSRWARQFAIDDNDAEDLVQDVLVNLLKNLARYRRQPGKRFRSWLATLLHHAWCNRLRRENRYATLGEESLAALEAADNESFLGDGEYRRALVQQAMEIVRPEFQESTWTAFTMHKLNGESAAQVATRLETTPGAVYAAAFRVLARLREIVRDIGD